MNFDTKTLLDHHTVLKRTCDHRTVLHVLVVYFTNRDFYFLLEKVNRTQNNEKSKSQLFTSLIIFLFLLVQFLL